MISILVEAWFHFLWPLVAKVLFSIFPMAYHAVIEYTRQLDVELRLWWSISHKICTWFCCALCSCGYRISSCGWPSSTHPYPSGLLHWHLPVKQPWRIWVNHEGNPLVTLDSSYRGPVMWKAFPCHDAINSTLAVATLQCNVLLLIKSLASIQKTHVL